MKIAIVGAGIVGVTTAWELASEGHEVTVLEQRGAAAEEASFAPAGLVPPGYIAGWGTPGLHRGASTRWWGANAPIRFGSFPGAQALGWMWRWQRAGQPERWTASHSQLARLASYSHQRLLAFIADTQIEFDRSPGHVVLMRTEKEQRRLQPGLQRLRDAGIAGREISADEARRLEPALNADTPLASAIHLPDDEAGNSRQFALILKNEAQRSGVQFEFGRRVLSCEAGRPATLRIEGEATARSYDAIVLCAGAASGPLLRAIGLQLPLAPVYGYSVSAQVREPLNAPRGAVTDERHQVVITRMGQRVRVAGGAEFGGASHAHRAATLRQLYQVLQDWFPGTAQFSAGVQEWKGARPCLPDDLPALGAAAPGIWLNLGHGGNGWALSIGSARGLADLIAGREPEIDLGGFSPQRFASR